MNSSENEKKTDKFLLMWDMYGLEAIVNISEYERKAIEDVLYERPVKHFSIQPLLLRARFNSQRRYEIYAIESELTEDEIIATFEENPQLIADTVRRLGQKIYSDHVQCSEIMIK